MKSYCDCLGRHPVLKKRSFSPNQNPWVLGQGMVAKLQYKEDKLNHQLMEIAKRIISQELARETQI